MNDTQDYFCLEWKVKAVESKGNQSVKTQFAKVILNSVFSKYRLDGYQQLTCKPFDKEVVLPLFYDPNNVSITNDLWDREKTLVQSKSPEIHNLSIIPDLDRKNEFMIVITNNSIYEAARSYIHCSLDRNNQITLNSIPDFEKSFFDQEKRSSVYHYLWDFDCRNVITEHLVDGVPSL